MPARQILIIVLLLAPVAAVAQDPTMRDALESARTPVDAELRDMRALGMAGAYVGGGSGTGALFHNPAGILTAPVYQPGAGFQRNFGSDTNAIGASVADAKTNASLAAAFSYSFAWGRDDGLAAAFRELGDAVDHTDAGIRQHDIRAALAFPVVPQRIALGAGVHFVNHRQGLWREQIETEVEVPNDENNPDAGTTTQLRVTTVDREITTRGLSIDAGILAQVSDQISIGFAARNLVEIDGYAAGRRIESGIAGYFDALHVEVAWFTEQMVDDSWKNGVAIGFEYVIAQAPVRIGYRWDDVVEGNFVTSGVGFRSDKVGGDVAFEQNVNDTDDRRIGAGLSLYF